MTAVLPTTVHEMPAAGGELCGADLSTGGTCERPVGECPYDSHRRRS